MLNKFKISNLFNFKSKSGLPAIIANTGWLFADRVLRMGVSLVVGVWVARYLGVQQYGLFNYAIAFVSLFNPLANLGLDSVVIRDLVRTPLDRDKILGTVFWLKLIGGIAALLLTVGCILLFHKERDMTVWFVAILAAGGIFQAFDTIDLWFQSQVQSKYTVIVKNIAFIIIALSKITLITLKAPLIGFVIISTVEIALGALGLYLIYIFKNKSHSLWNWDFPIAKNILKESWPLIFSSFAILIYMKIDQIMLGEMLGNDAVGIYSAATRVSEMFYFIPMALASSVSPAIFAAKEVSETLYYQRLKKFISFMFLVALTICVPISFLSWIIINTLFGSSYADAGSVLSIHIWASLFVFLGVAISPWFITENLNHIAMYRTVLGAITNILLNLWLIPKYSGLGAAIATLISYAVSDFFSNAVHPKTRKIFKIEVHSILFFGS
ncbi:flippase [Fortiea contorta]|uniref:flippase n=1 Tax=Fortiea contorta TaxID=1892405 RepID=UPI00034B6093|nr:flippase [Fortiea contorta]